MYKARSRIVHLHHRHDLGTPELLDDDTLHHAPPSVTQTELPSPARMAELIDAPRTRRAVEA